MTCERERCCGGLSPASLGGPGVHGTRKLRESDSPLFALNGLLAEKKRRGRGAGGGRLKVAENTPLLDNPDLEADFGDVTWSPYFLSFWKDTVWVWTILVRSQKARSFLASPLRKRATLIKRRQRERLPMLFWKLHRLSTACSPCTHVFFSPVSSTH